MLHRLPNMGPELATTRPFRTRAARNSSACAQRSRQGPTILDGTGFQHSLRASLHNNGSSFVHTGGHILDHSIPSHVDSNLSNTPESAPSVVSGRSSSRPSSRSSQRARESGRPQSQGRAREMRGPERFFYDRATFTGVHKHGGPVAIDAKVWATTMGPSHNTGST